MNKSSENKIIKTRRTIFIATTLFILLPIIFLKNVQLPSLETRHVKSLYEFIEKLPPKSHILIIFDYDPSSEPELRPMAYALLKHMYSKGIIPLSLCFLATGIGIMENTMLEVAKAENKKEWEDYVILGFIPPQAYIQSIIAMGKSIPKVIPTDHAGKPIKEIPAMKGVEKLSDIDLVIVLAPGETPGRWIVFGVGYYNINLAAGVTGVMAADFQQFLIAEKGRKPQMVGLLPGLSGAYQYEVLIGKKGFAYSMMIAIICIVVFILIIITTGNITYIIERTKKRK